MEEFHIAPEKAKEDQRTFGFWENNVRAALHSADAKRRELESFGVVSFGDLERKERLLAEAEEATGLVRTVCDLLSGAALDAARRNTGKAAEVVIRAFEVKRNTLASEYLTHYGDPKVTSAKQAIESLQLIVRQLLDGGKPPSEPSRRPFHWPLEFPEVFSDDGGFDAMVGNPPFMGGKKITGVLGTDYRNHLVQYLANGQKGSADLCAYFFLRTASLIRKGGGFGLLATNTIAQGDTREVGLDQLAAAGHTIPRAVPSRKWPGGANLEVAHVWVRRNGWKGSFVLEEKPVEGITAFLTKPGNVAGKPHRLGANAGKSFIGSYVLGIGFIMEPKEAQRLIEKDTRNRDVLFPYLNGEDLNSRPDQSPSRWVINFREWPLSRGASGCWASADEEQRRKWIRSEIVPNDYLDPVAADYPDCLEILRERVKPFRDEIVRRGKQIHEYGFWRFWDKRLDSYERIAGMERVLVRSLHANINSIALVPTDAVFSHALVVFSSDAFSTFTLLQGSFHTAWLNTYGSSIRTDVRYTPSDCFETFPFPSANNELAVTGQQYQDSRTGIMQSRTEGLTMTYKRLQNPDETSNDICELRRLHVEMDQAVAAAYGWQDLDLGHNFHETKQGTRYTISEPARREVLDRLLALNHERYEEEVRQGLHDKGRKKKSVTRKKSRKSGAKQRAEDKNQLRLIP